MLQWSDSQQQPECYIKIIIITNVHVQTHNKYIWLREILSNRWQCTRVGNTLSSIRLHLSLVVLSKGAASAPCYSCYSLTVY